jgi:hypothetical protein
MGNILRMLVLALGNNRMPVQALGNNFRMPVPALGNNQYACASLTISLGHVCIFCMLV